MDKRKNNAENETIKVEIAGRERPFQEEVVITDWSEAAKETAVSGENEQVEPFPWVLPEEQSTKNDPKQTLKEKTLNFVKQTKTIRFRNLSSDNVRLIFSVVLAIVIGLALGIFILKMVFHSDQETASIATTNEVMPNTSKDGQQSGLVDANMNELTVAVVQGGVFSTNEAASEYSEQFKDKGFPSTMIQMDGQRFLFIGLASQLTTAKEWASELIEKGEDVYAKQLTIPEKQMQLSTKEETKLFSDSVGIFQSLAELTAHTSLNGQLDDKKLVEIGKELKKHNESKISDRTVQQLQANLVAAYDQLTTYKQSEQRANLVRSQQALLNYLQIYYESD